MKDYSLNAARIAYDLANSDRRAIFKRLRISRNTHVIEMMQAKAETINEKCLDLAFLILKKEIEQGLWKPLPGHMQHIMDGQPKEKPSPPVVPAEALVVEFPPSPCPAP